MRITMDEIAKLAGVSKATVSRVLNDSECGVGEQTRVRVKKIAEELGYSVEQTEKKKNVSFTRYIALILPDITNPFFADLAKSVEDSLRRKGYSLVLANTDFSEDNEAAQIRELMVKRLEGILLVPSGIRAREEHDLPRRYQIPMVLMDRKLEGISDIPGVYSNNEYASVISCEHLIRKGARDIVFISGPLNVSTSIERFEGYKAVLAQHSIPFRPEMCRHGSYTVESGYNAVLELERSGISYSAILAANDLMALGALKAVREFGYRVPEDVQIIGFDNIEFSQYCEPSLSTMQQPTFDMGAKAVELLTGIIEKRDPVQPERLIPKLLMRKTTR
jgi:LacI family transcriptional regulator